MYLLCVNHEENIQENLCFFNVQTFAYFFIKNERRKTMLAPLLIR